MGMASCALFTVLLLGMLLYSSRRRGYLAAILITAYTLLTVGEFILNINTYTLLIVGELILSYCIHYCDFSCLTSLDSRKFI